MTRLRLTVAALVTVLALGAAAAASAAEQQPTLRVSSGAALPYRALVLGLPADAQLDSSSLKVFENGDRVRDVTVTPASSTGSDQFATVLVIDASQSMHGQPEAAALASANSLVQHLPSNSQVAVVAFNRTTQTLVPLTDDHQQVSDALAKGTTLEQGTHMYDGVQSALQLLDDAHIRSGSVVVLSDGADTGSNADASGVAAAAAKQHVAVYTVGLRSAKFDRSALEGLAQSGHGTFTVADDPSELQQIYDQLGRELANQYLLRYRTTQPPGTHVDVAVQIAGLPVAQAAYATPGSAPGAAFHHSRLQQFWSSVGGMVAIVLIGALLVGLAVVAVVRPISSGVRGRVGQYVAVADPGKNAKQGESATLLSSRLYAGAERSLDKTGFWTRFKDDIELAEMDVNPMHLAMASVLGALVVGWLLAAITGMPLIGLAGLAVLLIPRAIVHRAVRKRRTAFAEQLPDNLQVMASAMRAGHSLVGALAVVVEDSSEPSATEFRRVVADEQFGVPLEEALRTTARRMDNNDLGQVALVAALQRETGGNTAEVLERVTETIRERFELRRLVKTLTAQGRMSRWVVSLLPVGLLLIISALNPAYVAPLFTHQVGRLLLVAAAGFIIAGSLVIKRIVDIKV